MKAKTASEFDAHTAASSGSMMGNMTKLILETRRSELSRELGREMSESDTLEFMFGKDVVYYDFFNFIVFTR